MAIQTIKIGEEVSVDAVAQEYLIDETEIVLSKPFQDLAIYTTAANAGTIQFSVGITPPSAQKAVAADKNILVQGVQNGLRNLWAKGSTSAQKFTVL
jgi:hypothetical protein